MSGFAWFGLLVISLMAGAAFLVNDWKKGRVRRAAKGPEAPFDVAPRPRLLTAAESQFYTVLEQACAPLELLIYPKVGLSSVFADQRRAAKGQFERYAHLDVDFLLVTRDDLQPVGGVELDDGNPITSKQIDRVDKQNRVFQDAKLPLLRLREDSGENAEAIGKRLRGVLGINRERTAA